MKLSEVARLIAEVAHGATGQKRKYSGEDYVTHPMAVAEIVAEYTDCEYAYAAALLHDVIEDTFITEEKLIALLTKYHSVYAASQVVPIVLGVTKVSVPEDGIRAVRRALDHEHFAGGCTKSQLVKVADSLHNVKNMGVMDDGFRERYIPEKRIMVSMLDLAPTDLRNRLVEELDRQEGLLFGR